MREFYKQIHVDDAEDGRLRFYGECPHCGKRHYGRKLPLLCIMLSAPGLLIQGKGNPLARRMYNKSLAKAVQELAKQFNFCRRCGSWVCDTCYQNEQADDICKQCTQNDGRNTQ